MSATKPTAAGAGAGAGPDITGTSTKAGAGAEATGNKAPSDQVAAPDEEVKSYKIHVSSKYLDLTRQKLELTRLPHETPESKSKEWWAPKKTIEPLIDFWLEQYSWRDKENELNASLPQFRASFQIPASESPLRVHCVHAQSPFANAVPLLLIPPFPFTNLSLGHLVSLLTDPDDATTTQPFHLVIPSLPGLGFSDALPENVPMISTTANLFDLLMKRLGYEHYLTTGAGASTSAPSDIDRRIIDQLAFRHAESCLGVHLISPHLEAPTLQTSPVEWAKWKLASSLRTPMFGYTRDDIAAMERKNNNGPAGGQGTQVLPWLFGGRGNTEIEPNTLAYALCDSPTGLLLFFLTILRVFGPRAKLSPSDIITLTELTWLPGPEATLRFWAYGAAHTEEVEKVTQKKAKAAITVFLGGEGDEGEDNVTSATARESLEEALPRPVMDAYACPTWAKSRFQVLSTSRVSGRPGLVAWERPQIIADGARALAKAVLATDKRIQKHKLPGTALLEQVVVHGGAGTVQAEMSGSTVLGTRSNSSDISKVKAKDKDMHPTTAATADGHLAPPGMHTAVSSPSST
jgi:pimeloyl-ACP methyl ester carboxylesterase